MKTMYRVRYTASVTGSLGGRDDGHPTPATREGSNYIEMAQFFKEKMDEKGKRYGWEKPTFRIVQVGDPLNDEAILKDLEDYEKIKNEGEGI